MTDSATKIVMKASSVIASAYVLAYSCLIKHNVMLMAVDSVRRIGGFILFKIMLMASICRAVNIPSAKIKVYMARLEFQR